MDAAIVDQYLLDGNGWQVLDALKASRPTLPVIQLSATPAQPLASRASHWTFDAHLLKPLRIETFTQVLGERLGLVWQTQRAAGAPPPLPQAPPGAAVTAADLQILRQAAHEGRWFEVEDWIAQWRQCPQEQEFLDQLAPLAAAARLSAIVGLVDRRLAAGTG